MNNRRTEQFYNKKYIESKTEETKSLNNRKLTDKYNLKIKLVSTLIKSKNTFGLVLVGMNASIKKINVNKKVEEPTEVKRKIKKKKFRLTKLGKQVAAGIVTTTLLISTGTAIASTLDKTKTDIPVETTEIIEEYDDIFGTEENLAPIINETTPTVTPTPIIEETEPTEEIEIIEEIPEETVVVATPTPEVIEETTPITEETFSIPDEMAPLTIEIGYGSNYNHDSDMQNYYNIRERYGALIDHVAAETRWDPRILTALISQENPRCENQSANNTYGLTSITTVHQGEVIPYGYFDEQGNYTVINLTINMSDLEDSTLYMGGLYGNVTVGNYNSLRIGVAILQYNEALTRNQNSYLQGAEPGVIGMTGYNSGGPWMSNLAARMGNFNATLGALETDSNPYADRFYLNHLLYKIPEEQTNNLFFTSRTDGQTYYFNVIQTNEFGGITSTYTNTNANTL